MISIQAVQPNSATLRPSVSLLPDIVTDKTNEHPLSILLPYDVNLKSHKKLSDGLKEYKLLLIVTRNALEEFILGNLASFDSLVGENSCQIRATLISIISKSDRSQERALLRNVTHLLEKLDRKMGEITACEEKNHLGKYLLNMGLDLKVSQLVIFLVSSYVLTEVRVLLPPDPARAIVRNERTETRKVKALGQVGSSFAREFVKKMRGFASTISVDFIQNISRILKFPSLIDEMVSNKWRVSHNKFGRLSCLPCFWYTYVLMQYSLKIELPIALKIKQIASNKNYMELDEETFYFKVINGEYKPINEGILSEQESILVILASACKESHEFKDSNSWRAEISNYNIKDLILAYAAAHRQYPDESKDALIGGSQCKIYNYYHSRAYEWGCCLSNPALFFLVHAYCDSLINFKTHQHK